MRRRHHAGVAMAEALATLVLLGIAITSSVGILIQWHHHSQHLDRVAWAEQALASEMETQLALTGIERRDPRWRTKLTDELLFEARREVELGESPVPGAQLLTVRLSWGDEAHERVERQVLVGGSS
ncbi:MAG: hypothetical protein AAF533_02460 [Acidobacteriota bacterium]